MSDLSTNPKDPALVMSALWQDDCDRLEEAVRFASQRELAVINAANEDERVEAERVYIAAAKVRDRQVDRLDILLDAIFQTKAQSFEGAAAKLAVAIRADATSPDDPERPWPHLRSVHADLDRLIAALKNAAANDDTAGA
ncbi:hypothetical protein [Roseiterribacter gracilis]|uniref:Uncharacterized protein n=1 Tax=Roseiterribacter gracilis TaxID=2812848 RepID=A0A8S8X9C8_9PROT|nr:hypothetical protein TMPK1_03860 [Rhodospirillales bacterium TMPK1]